jgi:hypothetical protein
MDRFNREIIKLNDMISVAKSDLDVQNLQELKDYIISIKEEEDNKQKYRCTHRDNKGKIIYIGEKYAKCPKCNTRFNGDTNIDDTHKAINKLRSAVEASKILASDTDIINTYTSDNAIDIMSSLLYYLDKYEDIYDDVVNTCQDFYNYLCASKIK